MMFLEPVDIYKKLCKERGNPIDDAIVLDWVQAIFTSEDENKKSILDRLNSQNAITSNSFDFDKIDTKAIFHVSQIKKICADYRLRFLETQNFINQYPEEAISKIAELEKKHDTILDGFKIIAPLEAFKLKKADDPLLFAPMGNGYYHLIHKWGTDLHPLRKLKYWSFKNVENMGKALAFISILLTAVSYPLFFKIEPNFGYLLMVFMFYFKGAVGMVFMLCGSSGKNFSEYSWESKYDKIN
jgi:hypothetical protein